MRKVEVVLLTKPDCSFCDGAKEMLERLGTEFPLTLRPVSLESPEGQALAIGSGLLFPPGILLDGKAFSYGRPSEGKLRKELRRLGAGAGAGQSGSHKPDSDAPQVEGRP